MDDEEQLNESNETRVSNAISYVQPKTVNEISAEANVTPAFVRRFLENVDVDERDGYFRYSCANDWPTDRERQRADRLARDSPP